MCRSLEYVGAKPPRSMSGILGLLCRKHYPGLVEIDGKEEPAWSWKHYEAKPDVEDKWCRVYDHLGTRVVTDFWVSTFFLC